MIALGPSSIRRGLVAIALVSLVAPAAQAQIATPSPHGDLKTSCAVCHSPGAWSPALVSAEFDHDRFGFELSGVHSRTDCMACHQNLQFSATGKECSDCHLDPHEGQLSLDCAQCHGVRSFIDVTDQRRLHREGRFPLSGAHITAPCEECHPVGPDGVLDVIGIEDTCFGCHEGAYFSAKDPDHIANGFLQNCEFCHSSRTWSGGFFNHERQLLGQVLVCVECHQQVYDSTTDPRHSESGFSVQCEGCHNTRRWGDGEFDHRDFFPVNSGAHREQWNACSDCHVNATNFAEFDCLGCHPHSDRGITDAAHSETSGYVYGSLDCFDCHPRGRVR